MEATWWTKPEQLDGEQAKVIALPVKGDHLVLGPPGSGKTNLLLLRAAFLHKMKKRHIAVLTFGRVLREFLATGVENYPFAVEKIQTYLRWGASTVSENGVDFDVDNIPVFDKDKFSVIRANLLEALRTLAESGEIESKYDCILIDESQDYSIEEIDVIRKFTHQIFAVGDNHQQIYQKNAVLKHLSKICSATKQLTAHYRNGLKICRVADGIRDLVDHDDGLETSSNYDETKFPSSVRTLGDLSIAEQISNAALEIQTQLRAYPTGFIGVLCPRRKELREAWQLLRAGPLAGSVQLQQFEDGYEAFDSDRRVIVTTIHGAKGLEFRAVHLIGMDHVRKFPTQSRLAYTAVTRAKTSLGVYHGGPLPGYLERGLEALATKPPVVPPLDELFR